MTFKKLLIYAIIFIVTIISATILALNEKSIEALLLTFTNFVNLLIGFSYNKK